MSNIIKFPYTFNRIISFELPGYKLQVVKESSDYKIIENGKCIAIYTNMLKALNYYHKHKEAINVVRG
jgi:hypothetical protein